MLRISWSVLDTKGCITPMECWTLERMKIVPCLCQPHCCDSLPHSWCTWKTPSSQNISCNSPWYGKKGVRCERTTLGRKLWWISNTCPVTERIHKFNCCPCPQRWALNSTTLWLSFSDSYDCYPYFYSMFNRILTLYITVLIFLLFLFIHLSNIIYTL